MVRIILAWHMVVRTPIFGVATTRNGSSKDGIIIKRRY